MWGAALQGYCREKSEGDAIAIDTNHPLAGVPLNLDIKVVSMREASKDDLDHGHTYDDGHSH